MEALEAVAAFSFFADYIEDSVDELGTFCVVALRPVVAGSSLAEDEVVRAVELAGGRGSDDIRGSGLKGSKVLRRLSSHWRLGDIFFRLIAFLLLLL